MLSGISNPFGTEMQAASAVICTSLGLLAGRKICLALSCKLIGTIEDWAGMQNADAWKQAGDDYMALAKTDTFRDVAAVAGFVGAVALTRYAEKSLTAQEEEPKPEEPGYFQSYGVPALKYGAVFGTGVILRKPIINPLVGRCTGGLMEAVKSFARSTYADKLMEAVGSCARSSYADKLKGAVASCASSTYGDALVKKCFQWNMEAADGSYLKSMTDCFILGKTLLGNESY